jgi:hypothetical protein
MLGLAPQNKWVFDIEHPLDANRFSASNSLIIRENTGNFCDSGSLEPLSIRKSPVFS